jgi:ribosomal protein S18 acetylase RimI-like enzyme
VTERVRVRPAVPADVHWLAEVCRASFAPHLHPFLISAQPGIERFWEVVLTHPDAFPGRGFLVAESEEDGRLGFADLQVVAPDRAHLSYICVVEAARGRGIARTLLRDYVDRHPEVTAMQLDVFEANAPARALYDRLGFESDTTTTWWVADLPQGSPAPADGAHLQGLHAATAWMDTYGFAELAVAVGDAVFPLSRPSASVLRCPAPALLLQPAVLALVAAELPDLTQVLVVAPGEEPPPSDIGPLLKVNRSIRMSTTEVRASLESM